jgi:hypothetical protein
MHDLSESGLPARQSGHGQREMGRGWTAEGYPPQLHTMRSQTCDRRPTLQRDLTVLQMRQV